MHVGWVAWLSTFEAPEDDRGVRWYDKQSGCLSVQCVREARKGGGPFRQYV